jgi:hypothetical protein
MSSFDSMTRFGHHQILVTRRFSPSLRRKKSVRNLMLVCGTRPYLAVAPIGSYNLRWARSSLKETHPPVCGHLDGQQLIILYPVDFVQKHFDLSRRCCAAVRKIKFKGFKDALHGVAEARGMNPHTAPSSGEHAVVRVTETTSPTAARLSSKSSGRGEGRCSATESQDVHTAKRINRREE